MKHIYLMEKNIRGAWVIYGTLGVRQYYYYTKAQARKLYLDECKKKFFVCEKKKECEGFANQSSCDSR